MLTWTNNQQKEIFVTTTTTPLNLTSRNSTSAHGVNQQFWSYGQQLFAESMYLQVDHKIVFPPYGSI